MGNFDDFSLDIKREGTDSGMTPDRATWGAVCTFSYMYCYDISMAFCTDIGSALASCNPTCSCECAPTQGACSVNCATYGIACSGSTVK